MTFPISSRSAWPLALLGATLLAACGGGSQVAGAPAEQSAAKSTASVMRPVPARGDAAPAQDRRQSRLYIVQLADDPVTAYRGGLAGYAATKSARGRKIDPNSPSVVNYASMLTGKHDSALAAAGAAGKKAYSYVYVFNGFAAELSDAQAAKLATAPGVISVVKDEARAIDTSSTPEFLGLSGTGGFWATQKAKGEGVVIGIVDGGIWPEHPSVSDRTGSNGSGSQDGKLDYQQLPGWHGKCTPGEQFNASNCNQKLIGARYYNAGFGGNAGIDAQLPWEFNSPRDFGGHGTHTATTAGGNEGVPATGEAALFGRISGIAPRARIAAYKTCWETGAGGSCFNSDSVAAIDQAVADGVDVINFSVSGSRTNFLDPVEVAFLFAADAGVFVATSAGNSGPGASTVAHGGPWLTTVANGTHNRTGSGSTTLGNNVTYAGASLASPVPASPLVDAVNVGTATAPAGDVELCTPGALDAAKVTGKIVLCKRGVIALVDKSRAVFEAGGVGMLLYNDPLGATTLAALFHSVPTVHLPAAAGLAVKSYIAGAGAQATASIAQATVIYDVPAPTTNSSSSRGPLLAGGGDLLKPDVMAPGTDVLAGVAPPGNSGRLFDLYSGTSMSSPHVAGLGALMKELRPSWSPMAIKSAIMTTASLDVLDPSISTAARIFRQGAGHVQPKTMNDPGLVFDHGFDDWIRFLCGTRQLVGSLCSAIGTADPSDLNVASIAIGDVAGTQTVKRRVTNVGAAGTYQLSHTGMEGFAVDKPASLSLAAGETKEFTVKFTRTTATANAYVGGHLTLADGTHTLRVPMVVRPVALAAPAEVAANAAGSSYGITFGFDGAYSVAARGLVAAQVTAGNVADDPTDSICSLASPNAQIVTVAIPAGTTYARFATFDADVNPGTDIDLCVFNAAGTLVAASAGGTSAEAANLIGPAAGDYRVVVQGWGVAGTSPFRLHAWVLGSAAAGNMTATATPANGTIGGSGTVTLAFQNLGAAGTKYLGSVAYDGQPGMPLPTIVTVTAP